MIFIQRLPAPVFLSDVKRKWVKETLKAIAHYGEVGQLKVFKYDAYNDRLLKDELKKNFIKCAYCESFYAATSDGDVEHFRPKGKVSGKSPETPGYYWLSNDWDNLLLSCQHCNQGRLHQVVGFDTLQNQGKLDQFPLSDETKRVHHPSDSIEEENKVRLLLNPCWDNPDLHFKYDETEGVIIPLTEMGSKSIEVYALQRKTLVEERKKVLLDLILQISRVKRALQRLDYSISMDNQQEFNIEFSILKQFTVKERPYAGMCRFFVREFLLKNNLT